MPKSVLNLIEINLLLNSEEPKNKELYGNLYSVLSGINKLKAVSYDDLPTLDSKAKNALSRNKKDLIDTTIREWRATTTIIENPQRDVVCKLCNTPIKYLCYIFNFKNNTELCVGSECIKKFPNMGGYRQHNEELKNIHKNHKIITRRNEFYDKFPNCETIISEADKYFSTLPILLPYDLYTKLEEEIKHMRLIYTKYVNEGKKPFNSEHNSFELFKITISQYEELKIKADDHVTKYINNPLICKRSEIDWLNTNGKSDLLKQIAKNNGIYTLNTLKYMCSLEFVQNNLNIILRKNHSKLFKFKEFNGNNIIFSFNKYGYQPAITFSVTLSDFMNVIGANCIIYDHYKFGSEEILKISKIVSSMQNLESIIYFTYNIIDKFNYALLIDYETNILLLYRKGDGAIRRFEPLKFLNIYAEHILASNDEIKKFLFKMIVGRNNVKWITPEMQLKEGIDNKINRLYKDYKDNYMGGNYYNHNNQFEVTAYTTIFDSVKNTAYIDFDKPEYITLPRNRINIGNSQLKLVDYAIQVSDNTFEPYKKGDILLIQNTQNARDTNIIFFISEGKINIKECHTKNKYENIFQYYQIKKNDTQAFGRLVYCYEKTSEVLYP